MKIGIFLLQLVAALVMLYASISKFVMDAPVATFTALGMGSFGLYLIAILEIIAALLLFFERTAASGALLALGVLLGASIAHATVLGMSNMLQGVMLFTGLIAAVAVVYLHRKKLPIFGPTL